MTQDDGKRSPPSRSLPPVNETDEFSWDDDTIPRIIDPPFLERVTPPIAERITLSPSAPPDPSATAKSEPPATDPLELDLTALNAQGPPSSDPLLRDLADRYAMGDYSGALIIAEGILANHPEHAEALRFAKNCEEVLTSMYSARLGALDQIVTIGLARDQVRWLSLDHRSGFLLSLVDGNTTIEEILDLSGMPRLDALRILFSLFQERIIAFRTPG